MIIFAGDNWRERIILVGEIEREDYLSGGN